MLSQHNWSPLPTFWSPGCGIKLPFCRQVSQGEFSHLQGLRLISTPAVRWSMSSWSALSRWATDMKYVCTPVVTPFSSSIYFPPNVAQTPPLPANPGGFPQNFKLFAEPCSHLSYGCHVELLRGNLAKLHAAQEKEKNIPSSSSLREARN